jgi:uncharacterized membrane protein YdjX (TVP38/TMEM64 family)
MNVRYRPLLPVLAVLLALGLLHGTPLGAWLDDYQYVKSWLDRQGALAPLWFVLGGGVLTAVGVPRLALYFVGGSAFGFAVGLLYAQLGSVLGAALVFTGARWAGRAWVEARLAHHPGLRRLLDQRSVLAVFVLRQLPLASAVVSLALGVRHVPGAVFLTGTFLGFLPEGVPLALLGSGLGKTSLTLSLLQVAVAALMLLALTGGSLHLYRRWREIEPGDLHEH